MNAKVGPVVPPLMLMSRMRPYCRQPQARITSDQRVGSWEGSPGSQQADSSRGIPEANKSGYSGWLASGTNDPNTRFPYDPTPRWISLIPQTDPSTPRSIQAPQVLSKNLVEKIVEFPLTDASRQSADVDTTA